MVNAAEFLDALRRFRLLEDAQVTELSREMDGQAPEPSSLADSLVKRNWLTPFQANQLLQGRGQELILGSYVLLEKLGEGGMGTVFKARHRTMGRIVAVKVIRKDRVGNSQAVKRFEREIRAAAQLNHPNIVHAFDANEIDGTHFLVMEYVEHGTDLFRWVKQERGPLPVEEACEYIRQAALGLKQAHERGLVHRDIKPHNLLLHIADCPLPSEKDKDGVGKSAVGTRQSAIIKLLDLGLARLGESETSSELSSTLTQEGTVMGTLDYMAPEQAMDSHRVDIRADLYSLGCTLYFLLTGRVPFPGGDVMSKLLKHRMEEPLSIQQLRPDVPHSVAAILGKLMAKRPEDRYQSPAEVVQALEAQTQVQAVRPSPVVRAAASAASTANPFGDLWSSTATLPKPAKPEARRDPMRLPLALAGTGVAVVLLIGVVVLLVASFRGSPAETPTDASAVSDGKSHQLSPQLQAELDEQNRRGEAKAALVPIADRAAALAPGASATGETLRKDLREFLVKYSATPAATKACDLLGQVLPKLRSPLDRLDAAMIAEDAKAAWRASGFTPPDELVAIFGEHRGRHWGRLHCVAYSPDGTLIASAGDDNVVRLWDADTLKEKDILRVKPTFGPVHSLAFSPDGRRLLGGGFPRAVWLWDLDRDNRQPRRFEVEAGHYVLSVAFSPDGRRALSGGDDKMVRLWDVTTGKELFRLEGHTATVSSVAFSHDGRRAASGSADQSVRLWNVDTGKQSFCFTGHQREVTCLSFSPNGKTIASGAYDEKVRIWDVNTGTELVSWSDPGCISALAFRGDGRMVATSSPNHVVHLWETATGKPLPTLPHSRPSTVAFSPNGRRLASGGADGTVRLWEVESGKEVQPLTGHAGKLYSIAFSPDDSALASSGQDGLVQLWQYDKQTASPVHVLKGHTQPVMSVAFSPDGRTLASAAQDGTVRLWSLTNNPEATPPEQIRHEAYIPLVAISADGRTLACSASDKGPIALWDIAAAKPTQVALLEGHTYRVNCLAFSPDGRLLASGSYDQDTAVSGRLRLWDLVRQPPTERPDARFENLAYVFSLAFAPDGRKLAVGAHAQPTPLFDVGTLQVSRRFDARDTAMSVAFSPDGHKMALASERGGWVTLYDPVKGNKLGQWQLPGSIHAVTFANDGRHLATANANGTVYIFRLATPEAPALPARAAPPHGEVEFRRQEERVRLELSAKEGFVSLFDGKSLAGWTGDPAYWSVKNGEIVGNSDEKPLRASIYLRHDKPVKNFIMKLKFKLRNGDSGVFFRNSASALGSGYQAQILEEEGADPVTGSIKFGLGNVKVAPPIVVQRHYRKGDWNDYVIMADGPWIVTRLNDHTTAIVHDPLPDRLNAGLLLLQMRYRPEAQMEIRFRDIQIKAFPAES